MKNSIDRVLDTVNWFASCREGRHTDLYFRLAKNLGLPIIEPVLSSISIDFMTKNLVGHLMCPVSEAYNRNRYTVFHRKDF